MISNIKIKGGLLSKLFGNVNIEFTDALNILYGENGCGKSALFKTIADYCLIEHHIGSSKFPIWYDIDYQTSRHYTKLSSFECDWDGSSCFMYSGIDIQDNHSNLAYEMSTGKRVPELEYSFMSNMQKYYSSGEQNLKIYDSLLKMNFENLNMNEKIKDNSAYYKFKKHFIDNKSFSGKQTLLLDEIDSHLNLKNQYILHTEILPKLAEKFQIILISHSVMCFNNSDNVIKLDGSFDENKKILNKLL